MALYTETIRSPVVELEPAGMMHRLRSSVALVLLTAVVGALVAGVIGIFVLALAVALRSAAN